ncbi:class IV adenylate cyclase [Roseisolibacter sp. H3M3-2]|uniref:class IV adenylate cyclase n=1 Tax=Roseisolibacter sp. H3M3-2 TaxID=3031323 RepID=UPI0023DAEAF2|nr:class IV adenylate cyclase [Roseisolibacter sp. H3M3-2]MDF1505021.1 class IV adenylate cyclase [Roseisolibacter sp. H3M3-2]
MIDETELKAVVPDVAACRARVEAAGARLLFEGTLVDRRWDLPHGPLAARDEVLRVRTTDAAGAARHTLDWKGPTRVGQGYKRRLERSTDVGDATVLEHALASAGFIVVREVERAVAQYALGDATLRFERYPRLDDLVEVEGAPAALEAAIAATGLPRAAFTAARLADFVADFERRTRRRAALSARELAGG